MKNAVAFKSNEHLKNISFVWLQVLSYPLVLLAEK